jgi:hypothetical protein
MEKMTMLDTEYATLWYYPERKIVHHVFHKFIHGQEFRQVLEKGLDIFQQNGANKWLSDDRANSALPTVDLEWAQTDWFPRVKNAGWHYWAIVMPEKVVGQMNMKRFIASYSEQGLTVQVFSDPEVALKWLETVETPVANPS